MKAIVLAAGRGSRLGRLIDSRPDAPMRIGDVTLVERSLTNLQKAGVTQAVVVVDHVHRMLEEVIRTRFDAGYVRIIVNPDSMHASGSSLLCAADFIAGELLLLEADIFYHEAVMTRMAALSLDNALAMGHFRTGGVAARIRRQGGYVRSLAFGGPETKSDGDWVGMTRLSSAASATLRQALRDANPADPGQVRHYPDHVCRLVEQFRFRAVSIDDLPWTEIDNQGDLARANRLSAG